MKREENAGRRTSNAGGSTSGKRQTVSQTVTEYIVSLISEGHIRPGERLPSEHEIMRQLNVGRSSVREAIKGLAMMGIVDSRPRRGTIVISPVPNSFDERLERSITVWALKDLYEVRSLLEGHAAAAAARAATPEQIAEIQSAARAVENKIHKGRSYFRENTTFHLSVAKASRNPVLLYCLRQIINSLRDVREKLDRTLEITPEWDIHEHRRIVEAIQSRDGRKARRAMEAHMRSYQTQVRMAGSRKGKRRSKTEGNPSTG